MNISYKKQVDETPYFSSQGPVAHRKGKPYTCVKSIHGEKSRGRWCHIYLCRNTPVWCRHFTRWKEKEKCFFHSIVWFQQLKTWIRLKGRPYPFTRTFFSCVVPDIKPRLGVGQTRANDDHIGFRKNAL